MGAKLMLFSDLSDYSVAKCLDNMEIICNFANRKQ